MGENARQPSAFNPETTARFKRETWWQITFPVLAVTLLAVAAVVLVIVLGGPAGASLIADYALILIVIPILIAGLVVLGVIVLLISFLARLIGNVPPYTFVAQDFMQRVYRWVDDQTNRVARVAIVIRSTLTGITLYLKQRGFIPDAEPADAAQQAAPKSQTD